jgi:hypothetical protein
MGDIKWYGDKGWYIKMMGAAKAKKRIRDMTKQVGEEFPNAFLQGGAVIAAEAKRIITEKGHVVTGALRRSVHPEVTDWRDDYIEISVGTWLHYAKKIEDLPDGGYLFEAFERKRADALKRVERALKRVIKRNVGR